MYSSILCAIVFSLKTVSCDDEKVPSLCDNPIIHSADRLTNDSVRLYRGDYYWELGGLPDIKNAFIKGPFKIWYQFMAPINLDDTTLTGLSRGCKGIVYKFRGQKWWSWQEKDGSLRRGGKDGDTWGGFPPNGLTAAYHDANETFATVVGFFSINVTYYDANALDGWGVIGSRDGYIGGQFGENFPSDITSAFSWPPNDPKDRYNIYLFRRDKFCVRSYISKSGKDCVKPEEWISNKQLFCNNQPPPIEPSQESGPKPTTGQGVVETATSGPNGTDIKSQNSFALFLAIIYFKLIAKQMLFC